MWAQHWPSSGANPRTVQVQTYTVDVYSSFSENHIIGTDSLYADGTPHLMLFQHEHTGGSIPFATKQTLSHVDDVLKVTNTTDNGPMFQVEPSTGRINSPHGGFSVGGMINLSNSATDHSMYQVFAWKGVLTDCERAILYNGGNGITWADFKVMAGIP